LLRHHQGFARPLVLDKRNNNKSDNSKDFEEKPASEHLDNKLPEQQEPITVPEVTLKENL